MGRCLICYLEVPSTEVVDEEKRSDISSLIERQLSGIFILKELLKLPSNFLVKWLEMFPEVNPDSWISLCGDCGEMVGEGRRIFQEIVEVKRRLKVVQEKVVRKLKESVAIKIEADVRTLDIGEVVIEESRRFASEYNYGYFRDPFCQGDLEAYRRLMEEKRTEPESQPPQEIMIKEETSQEFVPTEVQSCLDEDQLPGFSEHDWEPSSQSNEGHGSPLESEDDSDKVVKPQKPVRKSRKRRPPQGNRKPWTRLIEQEGAFIQEDGKVAFRCPIPDCGKILDRPRRYREHKLRHSKSKFKCDQCPQLYTTAQGLYIHNLRVHNIRLRDSKKKEKAPRPVPTDRKPTYPRRITQEGAFIDPGGKIAYRCQMEGCSKVYRKQSHLQLHKLKLHSGKKLEYPCNQCDKMFRSQGGLFQHTKSFHGNIPILTTAQRRVKRAQLQTKCPHCDKVLYKYSLATHIKVVHDKMHPLYCELCGKGESFRRDMRYHQVDAHGICSVEGCKLAFPGDRKGLRNHQLECHGKEIDVFACEECGACFVRETVLKAHRRLHEYKRRKEKGIEGEEEWICDKCGKKFGLKTKFNCHLGWHRVRERRKLQSSEGNANNLDSSKQQEQE